MKILKNINLQVDKLHVLNKMKVLPESEVSKMIEEEYDGIILEVQSYIHPTAFVKRMKRTEGFNEDILKIYDEIILCVVTIGDDIIQYIGELFESGDYLRAILAENMADDLLFDLSSQIYSRIREDAVKDMIGLSKRLTPGEQLAMEIQKTIVEALDLKDFGIIANDSYVILPFKSMAYLYGVRHDCELPEIDFDCSMCSNLLCEFNKSSNEQVQCHLTESGYEAHSHTVIKGRKLLEVLQEKNMEMDAPCNGKGTCGKCKVHIEPYMEETESDKCLLSEDERKSGLRLACQCTIDQEIHVTLERTTQASIQDQHIQNKYKITPMVEYLKLEGLQEKTSDVVCLEDAFSLNEVFTLASLKQLVFLLETKNKDSVYATVSNNLITGVYDTPDRLYGLAIDIGTTTVVIKKISLETGTVIQTKKFLNPQRNYGADVISRIEYASQGQLEFIRLSEVLRKAILSALDELISPGHGLQAIVIAGNTTMIQLLLSLPSKALGQFPYRHVTRQVIKTTFNDIFTDSNLKCDVVILPALSSFVGGDISSGLVHLGFSKSEELNILIDLGTNGEIAIGNKELILTTATAAGPAFEGARLKCGTGSVDGAICTFEMQSKRIKTFKTIGDKSAIGLCGTGALDVLAELLRLDYVDETGLLSVEEFPLNEIEITEDIVLTQKDIRELQLAKSAIQSGIETLIKQYGCSYESIKSVYVAGGFSMNLKKETLARLGILPEALLDCVVISGNTSLGGAIDYMLNVDVREEIEDLTKINQTVQLAENPLFNEKFMENMIFKKF